MIRPFRHDILDYKKWVSIQMVGYMQTHNRHFVLLDSGAAMIDTTAPDAVSLMKSKVPILYAIPMKGG